MALTGILAVGLLAGCGDDDNDNQETVAAEPPAFTYTENGGPSGWADLDPSYSECSAGKSQSPIELENGTPSSKPTLEIAYEPAEVELENNGHSVEALYPEGSSITLDGTEYALDQFHYHAPSEHQIAGQSFPLEFHFVNKDPDGNAAVLGVLVTEGKDNPAFANLIAALPAEEDEVTTVEGEVNTRDLLPADTDTAKRWSYEGSLTTPPCTEGVRWTVFNQPIEMSPDQIAAYTAVYDHTNRPLQPLNGRELALVN